MPRFLCLLLLVCSFLFINKDLFAFVKLFTIPLNSEGTHEVSAELDYYYSCLNYTFALTDQPIPKQEIVYERELYFYMLKNFVFPRYVLFEVSAYPLPIAGVIVKREFRDFYDNAKATDEINWVKAVTAGYSEPYAGSILLGNVVNFVMDKSNNTTGRGFSGFMLSYGHHHIVDNIMVVDNWIETGLKIRGADYRKAHDMEWSYAMGAKFHLNPEIRNQFYLAIYRHRIDYSDSKMNPFLGLLVRNVEQQFRIDFSLRNMNIRNPSTISLSVGKHFPIGDGTVTFAFRVGAVKSFRDGYLGDLKQNIDHKWSMLIHPLIYFKFD